MLSTKYKVFDKKVDKFLEQYSILKYGAIVFSIVNLLDLLTTVIGLDVGLSERNFPMYFLIELFNGPAGFILVKVGVSIGILFPLLLSLIKKGANSKRVAICVGLVSIPVFLWFLIVVIKNINLILEKIY